MIRTSASLAAVRLWDQLSRNMIGLQLDIRANAMTWRASASAGSVPVDKLRGWMQDAGRAYQERLRWVADFRAAKPARWNAVLSVASTSGVSSQELLALAQDLRTVADSLLSAKLTTAEEIVAICDVVLNEVPAAESLWPE